MRKVLFIISSDPRVSPRPAEAIRIAAGVGAWARAEVSVCLVGAAGLILSEDAETLKDAEQFSACLPLLREGQDRIYLLREAHLPRLDEAVRQIDLPQLSQLALQHDVVARF